MGGTSVFVEIMHPHLLNKDMKKGGTIFRLFTTFLCPRFGHETYRTVYYFIFLIVNKKLLMGAILLN
ncbi:hypothetical protein SAMN05444672_13127 [Bacillus sp. OK838]|nr:hypothetical protein SAMN05444672_13127 [Bacillus sp. OK838]